MKKIIPFIASLAFAFALNAQETITKESWLEILKGLGKASNYAVAPYATYAPSAPTKWGGGVFVAYNVTDYVGVSVSGDWLGQFSIAGGGLTLKKNFNLASIGLPGVDATPFAIAEVGSAYGGAGTGNGGVSIITDAGIDLKFGHFLGGRFNAGAAWGKWTGAGDYSGSRYHIFAGWSKGF